MQPLIKYSIRVVVGPKISNGHGIDSKPCSVTREVFIVPFCTKAPPVAVEDLPGEYRLLATKTLKQHLWSKGMGQLEASACEPAPLNMATSAPRSASCLSLRLTYQLPYKIAMRVRPRDWQVLIESKIITFTFYSCLPLETAPNMQDVKMKPSIRLDSNLIFSETKLFTNLPWCLNKPSVDRTIPTSPSFLWVAKVDVPINVSKELLPTFFTPLAARRYALKITVRVAGLHHVAPELQLPLQLVHEPLNGPLSASSGDILRSSLDIESIVSDEDDAQVSIPRGFPVYGSMLTRTQETTSPPPYERSVS
jgi:hypothetical protein